jgi:MFS transporter, DHA2 family, multidrug resistance protein
MSHGVGKERWWALIALAVCSVIMSLDVTVLNLALPTLALKLHASSGDLQWFVDAYTFVFAAVTLPAGLLGDRNGRKRVILAGLVLFGFASPACAFFPSAQMLIGAVRSWDWRRRP